MCECTTSKMGRVPGMVQLLVLGCLVLGCFAQLETVTYELGDDGMPVEVAPQPVAADVREFQRLYKLAAQTDEGAKSNDDIRAAVQLYEEALAAAPHDDKQLLEVMSALASLYAHLDAMNRKGILTKALALHERIYPFLTDSMAIYERALYNYATTVYYVGQGKVEPVKLAKELLKKCLRKKRSDVSSDSDRENCKGFQKYFKDYKYNPKQWTVEV